MGGTGGHGGPGGPGCSVIVIFRYQVDEYEELKRRIKSLEINKDVVTLMPRLYCCLYSKVDNHFRPPHFSSSFFTHLVRSQTSHNVVVLVSSYSHLPLKPHHRHSFRPLSGMAQTTQFKAGSWSARLLRRNIHSGEPRKEGTSSGNYPHSPKDSARQE